MGNLAISADALGRHAEATRLMEEMVDRLKATRGPDDSFTLEATNALAGMYAAAGRRAEALAIREGAAALGRAKLGADYPSTLLCLAGLADSLAAAGRRAEALKLREEVLATRRARLGPDHPETLAAMNALAESDLAAGRLAEATALLAEGSRAKAGDGACSRTLAALQAWLGRADDYEATRRRALADAEGTIDANRARLAAQAASLRPPADPAQAEAALALARKAEGWTPGPSERLALGRAEFRAGHLTAADEALTAAANDRPGSTAATIADLYRAMSLFRQGKKDEARSLAAEAAAKMRPLPADEQNPLPNGGVDDLIVRLAYNEARALIGFDPPAAAPTKPDGK